MNTALITPAGASTCGVAETIKSNQTKMKIIYCIVPREDSMGVFYTVDTVTRGGSGGSTPFDQKPSPEEIEAYLRSVYPEMTESVWHIDTAQTAQEISDLYF